MLRALQTFWVSDRLVASGDLVDPKDPIVKGRESLFTDAVVTNVEQATAAPGEKRSVTRTRKARD